MRYEIYNGDCLEQLKKLPDKSVDTCITSPPYYGLRDYGTATWVGGDPNCKHYRQNKISDSNTTGHHSMSEQDQAVGDAIYKTVCPLCGAVRVDKQIGLEETPEQYVNKLVDAFREVKRVLKDDGTLWVNIGDTYNASSYRKDTKAVGNSKKQLSNVGSYDNVVNRPMDNNCKPKDLIGIPWMLAFALRADGWYLRQDIIYSKVNPMPESVKDRCTKSHEYIFLLSKNPTYYFDNIAIQEPANYDGRKDTVHKGSHKYDGIEIMPNNSAQSMASGGHERWKFTDDGIAVRNKRDVWTVATKPTKEAHFATFPIDLITPCVLAGSREGGTVLDPFSGSGTTGMVAISHKRNYIGVELNKNYIEISKHRVENEVDNCWVEEWKTKDNITYCDAEYYEKVKILDD